MRHGDDPVVLAFIPALMAALASTMLPVSNLTNLVVVEHIDVGVVDSLRHAAPAAIAAVGVGWVAFRATFPLPSGQATIRDAVDAHAIRTGLPVAVSLLVGFSVGERLGVPAWVVVAIALAGIAMATRSLPWRSVPVGPAVLALALGTLAIAAPALHLERSPGRTCAVGWRVGAPALLVALAVRLVAA